MRSVELHAIVCPLVNVVLLLLQLVLTTSLRVFLVRLCLVRLLEINSAVVDHHLAGSVAAHVELLSPHGDHVELLVESVLGCVSNLSGLWVLNFALASLLLLCGDHELTSIVFWEDNGVTLLFVLECSIIYL